MPERKRGRKKGEMVGRGQVQTFIRRRGGRSYIYRLYTEFKSANAVADHIFKRHNFYCSGNTIRNVLKHYHIPLNPSGGDRRSKTHVKFMQNRVAVID